MRVVALVSGGKDSCYNMMQCVANGHEIVALANLHPPDPDQDEMDSYMYQTVGHEIVEFYSQCMEIPLFRQAISGHAVQQGLDYTVTKRDETEDLFELLSRVKREISIDAVSVGAILSTYQRNRVEHVSARLGLNSLAYLWQRDQLILLQEIIDAGVHAILIKVAAIGFTSKHLGLSLAEAQEHIELMHQRYDLHPCGEGGEYETLVLDCPLFRKKLRVIESNAVRQPGDVWNLKLRTELIPKSPENTPALKQPQSLADEFAEMPDRLREASQAEVYRIAEQLLLTRSPENNQYEGQFTFGLKSFDNKGSILTACRSIRDCEDDFPQQIIVCLRGLENDLINHGAGFRDVVFVTVLLRDMTDFSAFNLEYSKMFDFCLPPSRACISVDLEPGTRVSIHLLICKDGRRNRQGLHVQSWSHWAPANIGPYSQAIKAFGHVFVSGQIGLEPANMSLPRYIPNEVAQGLQNLHRILSDVGGQKINAAVAYVTNKHYAPLVITAWIHFLGIRQDSLDDLIVVEVSQLPRNASVEWQVFASTDYADSSTGYKVGFCTQLADTQLSKAILGAAHGQRGCILSFTTRPESFQQNPHLYMIPAKSIWNILLQAKQFAQIAITEPSGVQNRVIEN